MTLKYNRTKPRRQQNPQKQHENIKWILLATLNPYGVLRYAVK